MKVTEVTFLRQSVLSTEEVCLKMCRLMGFVSREPETFAVAAGANLSEFIDLSAVHCDGWGISALDHGSKQTRLNKAAEVARTSQDFESTITNTSTNGALLHLRWATTGIPVSENNSHPFMYDGYTFIHNGAIYPKDALDPYIDDQLRQFILGDTDSEKYFYFLLTEIHKFGVIEGIKSALAVMKEIDFSSINAMILTDSQFITICEHDPDRKPSWASDGYYNLYYKIADQDVVVASSGWNQDGWNHLLNHRILVVDRSTLATNVLTI